YTAHLSKFIFEHPADVEQLNPALVILDIKFQEHMHGWMMLQKLRMYRPTSEIPLIVCTAAVREAQEQEAYLLTQHVPVVYKPFNIDRFLSVVRESLCVPATE
ncbi:MAG: response regulator, partial [Ktedonobacterales bacterium]